MIAGLSKVIGLSHKSRSSPTLLQRRTTPLSLQSHFGPTGKPLQGRRNPYCQGPSPPGSLRLQVAGVYSRVPDKHIKRTIHEYSYPEVAQVVTRSLTPQHSAKSGLTAAEPAQCMD